MPATDLSPNTDNYFVGAGVLKWKETDDVDFRDVGNCSKFEFQSQVTRLKHYSSRTGTRFKDKDVVTQVDATVAVTLDEVTGKNLAVFVLGEIAQAGSGTAGAGDPTLINILNRPDKEGAFRLVGTNNIGGRIQVDLPSVLITPSGALGLINAGTWGEVQLTAEVNGDINTGIFGRLAWGITTEIAYP